jgi:hypothetical protein
VDVAEAAPKPEKPPVAAVELKLFSPSVGFENNPNPLFGTDTSRLIIPPLAASSFFTGKLPNNPPVL